MKRKCKFNFKHNEFEFLKFWDKKVPSVTYRGASFKCKRSLFGFRGEIYVFFLPEKTVHQFMKKDYFKYELY